MAYNYPADFINTFWRIIEGDYYVSNVGDPGSANGSPMSPYISIKDALLHAAPGEKIVVGTGIYSETLSGSGKDGISILADGLVYVKGSIEKLGLDCTFKGFYCDNFNINGKCEHIIDCRFTNGDVRSHTGVIYNCLFIGSLITAIESNLKNCTFIDCFIGAETLDNFIEVVNCHFDSHTRIYLQSSQTQYFNYCNQEPGSIVRINTSDFNSANAVNSAYSQFQSNGISSIPVFNNVHMLDYTLHQSCPLVDAGSLGEYIGAYKEGLSLHSPINVFNSHALTNPILVDVIVNTEGNYQLPAGVHSGTIDTQEIDLQGVVLLCEAYLYAEQILEYPPPQNSVVDSENVLSNPNILTFEMRYSEYPLTSEPFKVFAWGKNPTIDTAGRGNGEINFDISTSEEIYARYVQLIITLQNELGNNNYPFFKGTSMAYSRTELAINVQDTYGNILENAQVNVDDGSNPVTGNTDSNGCFSTLMIPNKEFNIEITKQFYEKKACRAKLLKKDSLNNPSNNFVFILRDSGGNPVDAANVTIEWNNQNISGVTSPDGVFEGTIYADYEAILTIVKNNTTYSRVINPFIKITCGDVNLIVAQIIEYDFI